MSFTKFYQLGFCLLLMTCLASPIQAGLIVIGLDAVTETSLPVQVQGFTFELLSGAAGIGEDSNDKYLHISALQGQTTAKVRITATGRFDLVSFQIDENSTVNRTWEFASSSGGVWALPHGTKGINNGALKITLPTTSDWQNLSYVDILHNGLNPNESANASIHLDNFNFNLPTTSPEPSSLVLLGMAVASMAGVSRFRSRHKRRLNKSLR